MLISSWPVALATDEGKQLFLCLNCMKMADVDVGATAAGTNAQLAAQMTPAPLFVFTSEQTGFCPLWDSVEGEICPPPPKKTTHHQK